MTAEGSAALRRLLAADESLQWHGKPHRGRLFLVISPVFLWVVVVLGGFGMAIGFIGVLAVDMFDIESAVLSPATALGVTAVIGLVVGGGVLAVGLRRYDYLEYAATNRRLIAFGGFIGRDHSSVDWADIRDVEVSVGPLDRLLNTGTIHAVADGRGGVYLSHVPRPYEQASVLDDLRRGARR